MQVRDGDLGSGDQVQLVAGDDVHLVFLVRDLAGAGRTGRVDDGRRPDLGEPVLARVDVEEPVDQPALEPRTRALVHGEPGAGDLRAAGVVDDVERLTELPVRLARPGRATGRGVATDLAVEWLVMGQELAPGPDRDIGLFATDRDLGIGRIGDAQEQVVQFGLGLGQAGVQRRDPLSGRDRGRLELRDFRPIRLGAALDSLADALRGGVALGLEGLALAEDAPPLRVQLEGTVDERGVLTLVDGALADDVRFLAEPLQADAHPQPPTGSGPGLPPASVQPEASRARSLTKTGSRLARSQPARGPFARPRNAR